MVKDIWDKTHNLDLVLLCLAQKQYGIVDYLEAWDKADELKKDQKMIEKVHLAMYKL